MNLPRNHVVWIETDMEKNKNVMRVGNICGVTTLPISPRPRFWLNGCPRSNAVAISFLGVNIHH